MFKKMFDGKEKMQLTIVSAVQSVGAFVLNPAAAGFKIWVVRFMTESF